jgi:hypothetical protein
LCEKQGAGIALFDFTIFREISMLSPIPCPLNEQPRLQCDSVLLIERRNVATPVKVANNTVLNDAIQIKSTGKWWEMVDSLICGIFEVKIRRTGSAASPR